AATLTISAAQFGAHQAGDVLVVMVAGNRDALPGTASGWTRFFGQTVGSGTTAESGAGYYKIATSSAESFSAPMGNDRAWRVLTWVLGDVGIDDVADIISAWSASSTIPTLTGGAADYMGIGMLVAAESIPNTPSGGWTQWRGMTSGTGVN